MKKIKLLKPYYLKVKGDVLETAENIAELLVGRHVAEYVIDKKAGQRRPGAKRKKKNEKGLRNNKSGVG